jgi:hypothetical protein
LQTAGDLPGIAISIFLKMTVSMKRTFWMLFILTAAARLSAQTVVSFRFSNGQPTSSDIVAGWIAVYGDPSLAVRTATDPTTGISISSVSTNSWFPNGDDCADDGVGVPNGTSYFFPKSVMGNMWLNQGKSYA